MSIKKYQQQIDSSVQNYEKPYWHPLSQLARIVEEVGEISRILNHEYGDKPKKPGEVHDKLEDEIADVIYSLLCLANTHKIEMDEPLKKAIAKLETRDKNRFKKKQQ